MLVSGHLPPERQQFAKSTQTKRALKVIADVRREAEYITAVKVKLGDSPIIRFGHEGFCKARHALDH
jgi:hypothetical protein